MMTNKEPPIRKPNRLSNFDYSTDGAYFITICLKDRQKMLSEIVSQKTVGDGALDVPQQISIRTKLTSVGKIVERNLLSSNKISGVFIDQYVIMPEHIHAIVILKGNTNVDNGTSRAPSPTNNRLSHVVSTFKRFCNLEIGENIFQRGYYDHIIRDREDYETRKQYIYNNPIKRYYENNN